MACIPLLQALTPQDFKNQFTRGFNYLPVWVAGTYNLNEVVYYQSTRLFYRCLANGVTTLPTDTTFWAVTVGNVQDYVSDADITNAYAEACVSFNPGLFGDDADIILGYLYLAAYYVVNDLNANGTQSVTTYPVNSRSVGNVSESFTVPEWVSKNPKFTSYGKNSYGLKYLEMAYPKLIGNVVSVYGGTRA